MAIEGIKKTKDARIEDLDVARFAVASLILFFFIDPFCYSNPTSVKEKKQQLLHSTWGARWCMEAHARA